MRIEQQVLAFRAAMLASLGLSVACGGESRSSTADGAGNGGTTGGTGGATGGTGPLDCVSSTPELDEDGNDTGFATCDNGVVHRVTPTTCRSVLPRAIDFMGPSTDGCSKDADCVAQPHGYCGPEDSLPPTGRHACHYGCVEDAECDSGYVCQCGLEIGTCIPGGCTTDADCESGLCVRNDDAGMCSDGGPGVSQFACATGADACYLNSDCATGRCGYEAGARVCLTRTTCGIGRPFVVDGALRTAAVEERGDYAAPIEPFLDLDEATRSALFEHWQKNALLEHASIASFARFSLELLALGAPAELVAAAAAAMADETRHAELCFALASAYGDASLGPGPLSMAGVATETNLVRLVESVVREGCIGETVAALEAAVVAASAEDPAVRDVLEEIADDERRHGDLAFRFVRWIVERHPELRAVAQAVLQRELRAISAEDAPGASAEDETWLAHGVCPEALSRTLRSQALTEVVAPCLSGVIENQAHATPGAPRTPRDARGGVQQIP